MKKKYLIYIGIGIGALGSLIASYHFGKYRQRNEPLVNKVILSIDIDGDGLGPDGAIEFLDGKRKAIFMQKDNRTLMTYEGFREKYKKYDDIVNTRIKDKEEIKSPLEENFNYEIVPKGSERKVKVGNLE